MPYTNEQTKIVAEAKVRVAEALRNVGEFLDGTEPTPEIVAACARRIFPKLRGESNLDYFARVVKVLPRVTPTYCGSEIVEPFVADLMHRSAYVPKRSANPRADTMADMPTPISMGGVGNGREDHSRFVRGK